ncbi:hypothetical protein EW145_g6108 [Phellinidium pouzarii]|uniref:Cytochrome b5 heme-binding domain-containing protein n=1 Tax=Phellinidium pouzarii TaxID=167371 RepID=A0A4S4KYW5_9AGAM|nr:hypothetical protein EW145_g6108 [Phellinidium pouzarii]
MSTKELKEYSFNDVEKHKSAGLPFKWIIIDAKVYDVSRFANLHPGGAAVLLAKSIGESRVISHYARLQIGTIAGQVELVKPLAADALSTVPYAEPTWLSAGFHSPYYSESHRRFQKALRKFVSEVIAPEMEQCEQNGKRISQGVIDKMAEMNILAMRIGPGKHLKGRTLMGGVVKPEEFDYFHELIISFEYGRLGLRGSMDGLLSGGVIGLPPVLNYGTPELQARIVPDVLSGKKLICLAVSEAFAGSDVGGLQTTATLVQDGKGGKHWVVNGTKKWITNGTFADYFTTPCRVEKEDGKDGGYVVLLIQRGDGVETRPVKTSYSATAGTAFVMFDNVEVGLENTIGEVGDGMRVILSNFNHERWMIVCVSARTQRLIVEECLKWANQRIVFGKPLLSQAVVRAKIAGMMGRVEACQGWLESVTHQMNNMSYEDQSDKLAGQIALLKQFITRCGREIAEDATQIFGGRGITVTSPKLLCGAEDVMGDLGVRQAMKKIPKDARL